MEDSWSAEEMRKVSSFARKAELITNIRKEIYHAATQGKYSTLISLYLQDYDTISEIITILRKKGYNVCAYNDDDRIYKIRWN